MREPLRFWARGHPLLRATHTKTLEFTAESSVTGRATCVLGVSAELPPAPVAGPIRITIGVGTDSVTLEAIGNSAWQPGQSAVLRRSGQRLPDTFATDASLASADVPRSLAAKLVDPAAQVEVVVERRPAPSSLIRFRLTPTTNTRLRAELAAADLVLAEDAGARAALRAIGALEGGEGGTEPNGRLLSVSAGPGGSRPVRAAEEVIGWPAESAVLAAAAADEPTVVALNAGPVEIATLAAANPGTAVVFRADSAAVGKVLAAVGRLEAGVITVAVTEPERPRFGTATQPNLPERGQVVVRLAGSPVGEAAGPVEPAALVRNLLTAGASPRTIALALAGLPGWSRRTAYDFVLSIQR